MSETNVKRHWTAVALPPPKLKQAQRIISYLIGLLLVVMAVTQVISIQQFEDNFALSGLTHTRPLAFILILGELWAAAGFFQLPLSWLFRKFSNGFSMLLGIFWLGWLCYSATTIFSFSNNFFGRYFHQSPSWIGVLEVTVVVLAATYILEVMRTNSAASRPIVTHTTKRELKKKGQ